MPRIIQVDALVINIGRILAHCIGAIEHNVARPWPRLEQLAYSGKEALLLAAGCFPLLAAAAILEAGVARAPDWFLSSGLKLAVAAVVGILFVGYLLLFDRSKHAP